MQDVPTNEVLIQQLRQLLQNQAPTDDTLLARLESILESPSASPSPDQHHFQDFLKTLHHLNIELARINDLDRLYAAAVEWGASWLGFDRLCLLLLDGDEFIHSYGIAPDGRLDRGQDRRESIQPYQNRWEQALQSADLVALWTEVDVTHLGQIVGQGWQAVAAIKDGKSVIGALVADNLRQQQPPRPYETDLLALYSGTLGNLIARKQAEQSAREFQDYLKALHKISIELAAIQDLEVLYRRVVEVGLEALGFDRLGLFVADAATQEIRGTFGTDPQGSIRPEFHHQRDWMRDVSVAQQILSQQDRVWIRQDTQLWEYDSEIGRGWNAMAALWDGDQVLGYLVADNLLTHYPLRPYEHELLSLYGTIIGHLILRKQNDKALRDSEARFRMLLEVAPVAIILSRQGGEIISVNRMAEALFGFEREELVALKLEDLIPEHFREISAFFENTHNQSIHAALNMEPYGMRKDRSLFPIEVAISSFRSGSELMALSFILDLSEKMAAQQHEFDLRLEKERSHIMTEFIKDAAHEFRTPLSIIKSSAYLLERVTDETRRETLYANIHNEADSIVELVEGLTTTVRLDHAADSDFQLCNPNNVLNAAVDSMRPKALEKELDLELVLEANETLMDGNAEDLNLAFGCLLDNAARYTPAGGRITVRSEQRGSVLVVIIRDTGIGMSPEVQASAFERFYRADSAHSTRGFGLGLPIAQKVIQNHRGSIAVDSAPGKGSTLTVMLPLKTNPDHFHVISRP